MRFMQRHTADGRRSSRCRFEWLALLTLLGALPAACSKGHIKEMPEELIGVWRTSEPRYRDRFMEFRLEEVIISQGEAGAPVYPLDYLTKEVLTGKVRYTIHWKVEGDRYSMAVDLPEGTTDRLVFPNQQDMVWRRLPPR